MDRDIALQIVEKITNINTSLQSIVTGTTPAADNRSASLAADQQRSIPDPEEPEAPAEEPDTRTKK